MKLILDYLAMGWLIVFLGSAIMMLIYALYLNGVLFYMLLVLLIIILTSISIYKIALGQKSSSKLKKYNISHYKMYHPSGLNRKLNNKKDIEDRLETCYRYVRGES